MLCNCVKIWKGQLFQSPVVSAMAIWPAPLFFLGCARGLCSSNLNIAQCAELRDATQLCRLGLGRVCMRVCTGCDGQYGQH